jgi:hypothetical protein
MGSACPNMELTDMLNDIPVSEFSLEGFRGYIISGYFWLYILRFQPIKA